MAIDGQTTVEDVGTAQPAPIVNAAAIGRYSIDPPQFLASRLGQLVS